MIARTLNRIAAAMVHDQYTAADLLHDFIQGLPAFAVMLVLIWLVGIV